MMKKSIYLIINLFVFSVLFSTLYTSCKKDEASIATKDILTSKKWRVTKMEITPDIKVSGMSMTDLMNSDQQSCSNDDFVTFNTAGKTISDVGTIKCESTEAQTSTSDYVLSSDEKKITIKEKDATTGKITEITFDIAEISESTMVLSTDFTFDTFAADADLTAEEITLYKTLITIAPGTKMKITFTAI
jgi:hypothetical protein